MEDIVILIDGRPELLEEVLRADAELIQFISRGISGLIKLKDIDYAIQSSSSVRANPERGKLIFQRMKELSQLG